MRYEDDVQTDNGDGQAWNVVLAREIVQVYYVDGKEQLHYKPAYVLREAVDEFNTRGLKLPTLLNHKDELVGFVDEMVFVDSGNRVVGNHTLDSDLLTHYDMDGDTTYGASIGFDADVVYDPGEFNGQHYDYVQKKIRFDHVAILKDIPGRCSVAQGCGFNVDSNIADCIKKRFGELIDLGTDRVSAFNSAYIDCKVRKPGAIKTDGYLDSATFDESEDKKMGNEEQTSAETSAEQTPVVDSAPQPAQVIDYAKLYEDAKKEVVDKLYSELKAREDADRKRKMLVDEHGLCADAVAKIPLEALDSVIAAQPKRRGAGLPIGSERRGQQSQQPKSVQLKLDFKNINDADETVYDIPYDVLEVKRDGSIVMDVFANNPLNPRIQDNYTSPGLEVIEWAKGHDDVVDVKKLLVKENKGGAR